MTTSNVRKGFRSAEEGQLKKIKLSVPSVSSASSIRSDTGSGSEDYESVSLCEKRATIQIATEYVDDSAESIPPSSQDEESPASGDEESPASSQAEGDTSTRGDGSQEEEAQGEAGANVPESIKEYIATYMRKVVVDMSANVTPPASQDEPEDGTADASDDAPKRSKPKDPRVRGVKSTLLEIFKEDSSILKEAMAAVLIGHFSASTRTEGGDAGASQDDEGTEQNVNQDGASEQAAVIDMITSLWFTTSFETEPSSFEEGSGLGYLNFRREAIRQALRVLQNKFPYPRVDTETAQPLVGSIEIGMLVSIVSDEHIEAGHKGGICWTILPSTCASNFHILLPAPTEVQGAGAA